MKKALSLAAIGLASAVYMGAPAKAEVFDTNHGSDNVFITCGIPGNTLVLTTITANAGVILPTLPATANCMDWLSAVEKLKFRMQAESISQGGAAFHLSR